MSPVIYDFRGFQVDVAARELRHDGQLVVLPASVFDCLTYLLENRGRAVGRDELIAAVWGRTDVTDTVLGQTVLKARRALGDTGNEQHTIRTVPRFGYRWVAEVRRIEKPDETPEPPADPAWPSAPPPPTPAADPSRRRLGLGERGWPGIIAAAAVAVAALVAVALFWRFAGPEGGAALDGAVDSVLSLPEEGALVLPVRVEAGSDWSWLRLGLMDLVAERLQRARMTTVRSESVVALTGNRDEGPPALADPELAMLAHWRIQPEARLDGSVWSVTLTAASNREQRSVSAHGGDVVQATRAATDALLLELGREPPPDGGEPPALDELLQRTRAAMLDDQFELARRLIREAPSELRERPELVHRLAQIELRAGRYKLVQQLLNDLLTRLPADRQPVLRGRALITLAASHVRRNQADDAERSYEEAIELLRDRQEPDALGLAYLGRGLVAAMHDRLDDATAELGRARIEMRAAGDALGVAQVDLNLGVFDLMRQRPADALSKLAASAGRFEALGSREEMMYALSRITEAHNRLLDHQDALATSDRYWPPEAHTGSERLRWDLVLSRARTLIHLGRLHEARGLLERLLDQADPDLDRVLRAGAAASLVELEFAAGNPALAAERAPAALSPVLADADPIRYVRTGQVQARALRMQSPAPSAVAVGRLLAWAEGQPATPLLQAHARLAWAEQAAAVEGWPAARAAFEQALEQAEAVAVPDDLVEIAHSFTLALIAQGDRVHAQSVAGRISPWAERDARAAWAQACLFAALGREEAWQQTRQRARDLTGERVVLAAGEPDGCRPDPDRPTPPAS